VSLSSSVCVGPRYSRPLGSVRFGQFSIRLSLPSLSSLRSSTTRQSSSHYPKNASLSFSSRIPRSRRCPAQVQQTSGYSITFPVVHACVTSSPRAIVAWHTPLVSLLKCSALVYTDIYSLYTTQISGKSKVIEMFAYLPYHNVFLAIPIKTLDNIHHERAY
jgi:hypothetical protein